MAVLTLRDVPDDLQQFLKQDAARNHRSLNKHAIAVLAADRERKLGVVPPSRTPAQKRAAIDRILASARSKMVHDGRTPNEILGYDENGLPA